MKKTLAIYIYLAVTVNVSAQKGNPGYMGKHLSIGYSNYLSPRLGLGIKQEIASEFYSEANYMHSNKKLNSVHCLDLDYIIGRKTSLCVSGQYTKFNICSPGQYLGYYYMNDQSGEMYYQPSDLSYLQSKSFNVSVGFKFFKKKYMNPYGRYRKVEFILVNNTVNIDPDAFVWQSYYFNDEKVTISGKQKFKTFAFAYTIGKQRVFYDKLIFDWGIRFGLEGSRFFRMFLYENDDYSRSNGTLNEAVTNQLKNLSKAAVFESQLLSFHIGLKFLAF